MEPTVHEIVVWVDDVALSIGQIQKAYDWSVLAVVDVGERDPDSGLLSGRDEESRNT
jgi:hypothetical protein